MQDDMNRASMAIVIEGGRISAGILRDAIDKALRESRVFGGKSGVRYHSVYRGRQSLSRLAGSDHKLSSIEITDKNIRSFEQVARKYSMSYALKKDKSCEPPRYLVFFKARDYPQMKAAFKEYVSKELCVSKKPSLKSIVQKLEKSMEHEMSAAAKTKDMERGFEGSQVLSR